MDKIKQLKPYLPKMDVLFSDLILEFNKSKLYTRDNLPTYSGIYVFYEKKKPIYVGRANNIKKRIQWHTRKSSSSESASFAFNLSKLEFGKKSTITKKRKELMAITEFLEIFEKHKLNLSLLQFKCIEIKNDILQSMFETYLALKLKTYPINNTFENH
jgi:GIY-YIG catalytic domain